MKELTAETIVEITGAALESMAFMVMDSTVGDDPVDFRFLTRIQYHNDGEDSQLYLAASEGFTTELAAALLGIELEDVDPDSDGAMALSELTNILAGEVGRVLGAETSPFEVGIPEVIDGIPVAAAGVEVVQCLMDSMGDSLRILVHRTGKE